MKHALVAVALLFSCSINKKSGDYACTTSADCNTGRVCLSGFCVVSGDGGIDDAISPGPDGTMPPPDASRIDAPMTSCPPGCTSCDVDNKTCEIDCDTASCANAKCPTGYDCTINCTGTASCGDSVDCTQAAACTIACSGSASCGDIECGSGSCEITCSGRHSCGTVDCGEACACDLSCTGTNSCRGSATSTGSGGGNITCGQDGQCIGGGVGVRCQSTFPGCDTCP